MRTFLSRLLTSLPVLTLAAAASAADLDFSNGVDTWRVVVDGVMGGRSSGRVTLAKPGVLQFAGDLSLENNGGFSQMRTNVSGGDFEDARGIEITVRGDGRTYKFDVRCSHVRMMAGGFQQDFRTEDGEWTTIRLPFDDFRLYSFGREVRNAPALETAKIESVGVTLSDKRPGPFRLQIDSIRTFGNEAPSAAPRSGTDLVSVARDAGLNTLLKLVTAAELELPSDERVTIFAPTDAAFAALPEATVRSLLSPEGRDTLRAILTYHATAPALTSSDLLSRRSVETLNGQRLGIDTSGAIMIGEASVLAVDVPFDGGVVHVIDRVLMPELKSIGELAAGSAQLSTLAAAVSAAGLEDQLGSENGPFTVFAPVDSAFGNLPAGTLESLLETDNRQTLVQILGLHVVPGRLYANELLANRRARTFFGEPIEFSLESGRLQVGGASIIASNIEAGNGVVHLIDTVLLPAPSATTTVSAPSSTAISAEGMRLCELAVNRGAPLFNDGNHEACAAIYEITLEAMIALGANDLGRPIIDRLELAIAEASTQHDWLERAWTYRRALDDVYTHFARQVQSSAATASR